MAVVHADPGSSVYAGALFEAVEAEGGMEGLREAGEAIEAVAKAWREDRVLRAYFLSSEVSRTRRRDTMQTFAQGLPTFVGHFLRLLFHRGRLSLLPGIASAYRTRLDARLGRVPVTITTAVPVPENEFQRWTDVIRASVGGEPVVEHVVEPDIVAGAVIRVGDRVADGSARRKLAALHQRILESGKAAQLARSAAQRGP